MQWKSQINGKGGLLSALNSRLYIIRRLQSHLSKKSILKLVDGLFTSKVRYGLQLYGRVRTQQSDPVCEDFKDIQLAQNNMLRALNNSKVKDMVSTQSMLTKFNTSSVNQLNAQCKLLEIWKARNVVGYPLQIEQQSVNPDGVSTRADAKGRLVEIGKSNAVQKSCVSDAIRLWNLAPTVISNCNSLYSVKKEIKKFARQLPI